MKHPLFQSITLAIDDINTELLELGSTFAYRGFALGGRYYWIDAAGNAHSVRARKRIERILERKEQHRKESK